MRSVPPSVTSALTNIRKPSGRLTIRDTRLVFNPIGNSDGTASVNGLFHDADIYANGILRAASVYDGTWARYLYYQYVSSPEGSWPAWVNTGIRLAPNSGVGVHGNRIFYHAYSDGDLCYVDYNAGLGTPVKWGTSDILAPHAIAPISASEVYLHWQLYAPPINTNNEGFISHYNINTDVTTTWKGKIFGPNQFVTCFDAVRLNGVDYIFFTDVDTKRTLYMTRAGGVWSEIQHLVPLDIVDDTSLFTLGGANVINGKIWVTGVLSREIGGSMHIYSFGPPFSLGRDMFIRLGGLSQKSVDFGGASLSYDVPAGKMLLLNGKVYYVGLGNGYRADATMLVGYDNVVKRLETQDVISGSIQYGYNAQSRARFLLKSDLSTVLLKPGNEVNVELGYSDNLAQIGKFEIDTLVLDSTQSGRNLSIELSGLATKRLSQWTPDSNFDYWSQTKMVTNAGELTKVVRSTGQWEKYEDGLRLTSLNEAGYLYSVERPSRGVIARAKFKYLTWDYYTPRMGIVLNYYRETVAEAKARLGVDELEDSDYGHNGILVSWGTDEGTGVAGISVHLVRDNQLTKKAFWPYSLVSNTAWWLQAEFHEGLVRVLARLNSSSTWTAVGEYQFTDLNELPWKRDDQVGRVGLYLNRATPNSPSYPFDTTDMVIPVEDNSAFPPSGEVIVDSERMYYAGKSSNNPQVLEYTAGDAQVSDTNTAGSAYNFSDSPGNIALRKAVTFTGPVIVNAIKVYVQAVGQPEDGLTASIYTEPTIGSPMGIRQAYGITTEVGGAAGWITIMLDSPLEVEPGKNYYVVIHREDIQSPSADCYATVLTTGTGAAKYVTDQDAWTDLSASMPFQLLGYEKEDAYQIMVQGVADPPNSSYFNDMALVVTGGKGQGRIFRVTGYKDLPVHPLFTGIFFVDKDPAGLIGSDTVFRLSPTLKLIERGWGGTMVGSHANSRCHIFSDLALSVYDLETYTAEMDMRLEDVINEIASKAGVRATFEKAISGVVNLSGSGWQLGTHLNQTKQAKYNFIVRFKILSGSTAGVGVGLQAGGKGPGYVMAVSGSNVVLYYVDHLGALTALETVPLGYSPSGWITMSCYEGHLVTWINGRLAAAFKQDLTAKSACLVANNGASLEVDWSALDMRVDNFIMDMGVSGLQMVSELIANRKVFFTDGQNGDLKVFVNRTKIGSTYNLQIEMSGMLSDAGLFTRVRIAGLDQLETQHADLLKNYGNVFRLVYSDRAESIHDLEDDLDRVMNDMIDRQRPATIVGAFDPRVEVQDILTLNVDGSSRDFICEEMNVSLQSSNEEMILDMEIVANEDL